MRRQREVRARLVGRGSHVLTAPEQLDDRQRQIRERVRCRLVLRLQERLQRRGIGLRRQRAAVLRRQIDDARPPLRFADDAADRGQAARVEELHHGAVRRDHEVLDQPLGAVRQFGLEIRDAVVVHDRLELGAIEVERAALVTFFLQPLRDGILLFQLVVEPLQARQRRRRRAGAVHPRGDGVVGELRLVADQRPVDVARRHGARRR